MTDLEAMRARIIAEALADVRARGARQQVVSRLHEFCDDAVTARRDAIRRQR